MSKKKWKYEKVEAPQAQEDALQELSDFTQELEKEEEKKMEEELKPHDPMWDIHDAARQMIHGFQERWWPSIRKMADMEALGEQASDSQCRACFLKWGAKLK